MKVLISGGEGLLATELIKCNPGHDIIAPSHTDMDITLYNNIFTICNEEKPDMIIHCAAMTHPMKNHYTYPEDSIQNNIIGTANIATACIRYGIKPVYISTDYVYKGDKDSNNSYKETDGVSPVDNYGWSKLGGECAINMVPQHLILRCCFTQRPFRHDKAFTDLYKSYMYVDEIAPIIWQLIDQQCTGTYNVGGESSTVYDFAVKESPGIGRVTRDEVPEMVPYNTSMDVSKLSKELHD